MYIWYVNPPCGSGDGDYSDIHPFQSLMSLTCSEFATLPKIPQNRVEPGWKVKTISNIWISGGASRGLGCWMPPSSPVESYSRRNLEKQLGRNNHTPTFLSLFGKPTLQLFSPKEHDLNHHLASSHQGSLKVPKMVFFIKLIFEVWIFYKYAKLSFL